MKDLLKDMIKSGYKIILLSTIETDRAIGLVGEVINELNVELSKKPIDIGISAYSLKIWDTVQGLDETYGGTNYLEVLRKALDGESGEIFFLCNYHRFLNENHNLSAIAEYFRHLISYKEHVILILQGNFINVPHEIRQYCGIAELKLPSKDELIQHLNLVNANEELGIDNDTITLAAEHLVGLSLYEAEKAFALCIVKKKGKIDLKLLQKLKTERLSATGFLEIITDLEDIENVGGLAEFKDWITQVSYIYKNRLAAIKRKVPIPKGTLLAGVPGTGKTMLAKVIASLMEMPLLRLDVGKLFNSRLGETEANTRKVLNEIEAQAPCVVLIDEAEKSFSGLGSSDMTDGGTTSRVISSFLYFMQENQLPIFFVYTVNNIKALPPELTRQGRIDEIWFLDLPSESEREAIISIHLRKMNEDPARFNVLEIARATNGFTGAEIENVIKQSKIEAFCKRIDLTTENIIKNTAQTCPLSKSRYEEVQALREWGTNRARIANRLTLPSVQKKVRSIQK